MSANLIGLADFPDDQVLIARGKYSTLGKARTEQLKRAQAICQTMMTAVNHALRDCEKRPPEEVKIMETIQTCFANLTAARTALIALCMEMEALKPLAWDGDDH